MLLRRATTVARNLGRDGSGGSQEGIVCLRCILRRMSSEARGSSAKLSPLLDSWLRRSYASAPTTTSARGPRRALGDSGQAANTTSPPRTSAPSGSPPPVPFFNRSESGGGSIGGGLNSFKTQAQGGYFFGNERLFVGQVGKVGIRTGREIQRRWNVNVAASAGGESVGSNTGASSEVVKEEVGGEVELSAMLPHRRRQFLKHQEELKKKAEAEGIATTAASDPSTIIPPDASSLLSTHSSTLPITSLKRTLLSFLALSKPRLTFLVVLSAAASYALFPTDPLLASLPQSPSLPTLTLLYLTIGTSLTSASANTLNMYLEPAYDSQMTRTRNRPLVRGLLTPRQALLFALFTGATGTLALYYGVNPTVSALGAANILLYAGIYTPLKRIHIINTWVGAIVGGIPPLMGWAAAAGAVTPLPPSATFLETSTALLSHPGGWLLFGLLFAWQFPHFNALSYTIRHEYANAGYKMMSSSNPALNARVALRYSFLFFPICVGLSAAGVTDWGFVVTSSVVNGWLVREAWRFWKVGGDAKSARALFWCSVWHLPGVMVLAMVHKSGLWRGVWRSIRGEEEEEYDEDYED